MSLGREQVKIFQVVPAAASLPYGGFSAAGFCDLSKLGNAMKVKEVIALIESDGWIQVRQRGSHRQFHHPTKPGTVTVSGIPSIDVPPDTLNSVLKQAGLKK